MMKYLKSLLSILVVSALATFLGVSFLFEEETPQKSDVIIVLGYKLNSDGSVPALLEERINKGVVLYKEGLAPYILFSGGMVGAAPISQAEAMSKLAQERGVPASAVLLEPVSRSTVENAQLSIKLMKEHHMKTALLITSPFHTLRARRIFKDQGQTTTISAAAFPRECTFIDKTEFLLSEIKKSYTYLLSHE